MLHKAWNSKGKMPYCFPRSSIKFQGHTVQNITDFDPNWAFPDYRPVAAFKSLRFALLLSMWQGSLEFHWGQYELSGQVFWQATRFFHMMLSPILCSIYQWLTTKLQYLITLEIQQSFIKTFILCITAKCVGSQAPVPLTVFQSNSKFDKNLECCSLKYAQLITTKFCTHHDSFTVVTCAKFCCDRQNIF